MTDREALRAAFLRSHAPVGIRVEPLPVDASARRYFRLYSAAQSLILMDADPQTGEDVRPFLTMAAHLRSAGLAAPKVIAEDIANGFLLLEDLGSENAASHLNKQPGDEPAIYKATAETLAQLQDYPPPTGLLTLTGQSGADMLAPLFDWYDTTLPRFEITDSVSELIDPIPAAILSLRDLHAANIIWRPDQDGPARIGLLDFQDAWIAPRAYDLASLLDDPRRDVSPRAETAALARYSALTGVDPERLATERAVLSVQRNLRILGIFARLIRRDSRPRYAAFLPRLRAHLDRQSLHPTLSELRPMIEPLILRPPSWL